MKHFILLILSIVTIISCGSCQGEKELNPEDISLRDSIQFDKDIFSQLRASTDSSLTRFVTKNWELDEATGEYAEVTYKNNGLVFNANQLKARVLVNRLKDDFRKSGYIIFIADQNFGYEPDQVAVVKTDDQFELLKMVGTEGINYELENKDVIEKLRAWNELYPFTIVACQLDLVEAEFITQPADMLKFAEEVYEFCPDVVDQGAGSIEELATGMKESNTLYLWWD